MFKYLNLVMCSILLVTISAFANQEKPPTYWDSFKEESVHRYHVTINFWSNKFQQNAHPSIIKFYSWYYANYGEQVGHNFWRSYEYLEPKIESITLNTLNYYKENHPLTFRYLADIPAFIKIAYEKFILSIWQWLYTLDDSQKSKISASAKPSVDLAMHAAEALQRKDKLEEEIFLNQLLDQIKTFSFDYGMQDCYQVVLINSEILNAFNIGCNIFFSKKLYSYIGTDHPDQLRAILAHELSHGDRGHGMKTFFSLISSGAKHFAHLSFDQLLWLATGEIGDYSVLTTNKGHLHVIKNNFADQAPAVELDADMTGTLILNRAGFSALSLITALERLHQITGNIDCTVDQSKTSNGRNYPSLCNRVAAIKRSMRF